MDAKERHLRAIVRLLALNLVESFGYDMDKALEYAYKDDEEVKVDQKPAPTPEEREQLRKEVEAIYALYPSKCPKRGTSTGKSYKDKEKIARLIRNKGYQYVHDSVVSYIKDCKDGDVYMKNFSTLLNNLPEPSVQETLFRKEESKYQ